MSNSKILFIPGYFKDAEQRWVNKFISEAESVLKQLQFDYISTSPLNDLDSNANIESQIKGQRNAVILLYLVSWVDPNVVVDLLKNFNGNPIIIWCADYFIEQGRKTHIGPLAGFLPIKGSLERMGIKFTYIYGNPNKAGLIAELKDIFDAADASIKIKQSRIGFIGYTALGMYPGMVDPLQIKRLLGTEIVPIDNHTLINLYESILNDEEIDKKRNNFKSSFKFAAPIKEKDECACIAMTDAIEQIIQRNKLSAITLRCLFELSTDLHFAPCVPLSILSDKYVVSCESDIPVTLSQLVLHFITSKPTAYVDIIMMEDFRIYGSCCGFGAFAYSHNKQRSLAYANSGENKAESTMSYNRLVNNCRYEDGIYTLARLKFKIDGKCCLQIILGENKEFEPFYELDCNEFPSMSLVLKQNTSYLLEQLGSQHFALIKGNIVNKLKYFCKFFNIEMKIFS